MLPRLHGGAEQGRAGRRTAAMKDADAAKDAYGSAIKAFNTQVEQLQDRYPRQGAGDLQREVALADLDGQVKQQPLL